MDAHDQQPEEAGRESAPSPRHSAASPAGHRAGFREEHDRLVLANAVFSLAFSTLASGTIAAIQSRPSHTEFVRADEAVAEGHLWRLAVETREGSGGWVSNRTCAEFAHQVSSEPDGSLRLRLIWRGLRIGAGALGGEVVTEWLFPAHGATALAYLAARLPGQLVVRWVEFPCLCALGASDPRLQESLVLPLSEGVLIPEPRGLLVPGESRRWEVAYPGQACVQLMSYSCGADATIGLACHDPSGAEKRLAAGGMPRSNRLTLSAIVEPTALPDGGWGPGFPAAVSVVAGDWLEAAREYRTWAVEQAWCARGRGGLRNLPPLLEAPGLWVSFWGGPRAVLPVMRDLQRLVAAPLKLDWRCWHGCVRGDTYPDYFPPREGEQVFTQATSQLAEAGMLTQLSFHGALASPRSESWRAHNAERYAIREPAAPGDEGQELALMCPLTDYWQHTLADTVRGAIALGANGVYVEGMIGPQSMACDQVEHGHSPSGRERWAQAIRAALAAARRPLPPGEAHLAVDGPWEGCLDLADVMLARDCAAERLGLFPESGAGGPEWGPAQRGLAPLLRWRPVPLFSAVYHAYATLASYGISLANNQPYDPQWSAERIASLHEPKELMGRDFSDQFYLEAARAIVGGKQLMVTNLTQRQVREELARRKLAFLRAALQTQSWGAGKLLPFSDFVGLLEVEATPVDIEMLVNPEGADPEGRYLVHRREPPVLGSAWLAPGGSPAVVLVNIHTEPVEFSATLRCARLGMSGMSARPRELSGRTFSPDSDAPAAALHASGSGIAGRLPGRAIFLLSLR